MKKYKKWLIGVLMVLLALLLAGNYMYGKKKEEKNNYTNTIYSGLFNIVISF